MAITMIVGLSTTGKSTLAKTLAATSHKGAAVFHLDDYIHRFGDHGTAIAHAMRDLQPYHVHGSAIAEGCTGFAILVKWLQLFTIVPHEIYMCTCTRNVRHKRHIERGNNVPAQQDVMLLASLRQWEHLLLEKINIERQPTIIPYDSSMY